MAVTSVTETAERRSGEDSLDRANGIVEVTRGYTRSFIVETDDPSDGWEIVKRSLPALNSFYESGNDSDLKAVCTGRSGDQRAEARNFWDCECEYSTDTSDAEETGGSDPEAIELERELRQTVRWSLESKEIIAIRDIDGNVIQNSAGDPFDPPAMTTKAVIVANITRYELPEQFSVLGLEKYADAINSDAFTIDGQTFEPGEAFFAGYDSVDMVKGGRRIKQVTYVIKIQITRETDNPEEHEDFSLWDIELLEHGPNYYDSNSVKRPAVDSDTGFRYTVNLDGETGGKLTPGEEPWYSFFKIHPRQSFADLGFDA